MARKLRPLTPAPAPPPGPLPEPGAGHPAPEGLVHAIRSHLLLKITIPIAAVLFTSIFLWAWYQVQTDEDFAMENLLTGVDRVVNTVTLGLRYSMMLNSREDIQAVVSDYSRLREIRSIRILNKEGVVMFASNTEEKGERLERGSAMCQVCHAQADPPIRPPMAKRVYSSSFRRDDHIMRLVSPIENDKGCSQESSCHFHRPEERILGVFDIVFSLSDTENFLDHFKANTALLAFALFGGSFATLFLLVVVLIKRPVSHIMRDAAELAQGRLPERTSNQHLDQPDELGELARSIHKMGSDLIDNNTQLTLQKNLYRDLFEGVPCLVTVQDRNFRLLRFNKSFAERFSAEVGQYCYKAYKNREVKCRDCPVEKTFQTGLSVCTEESGQYKDGSRAHWIVTTAPVYDSEGHVVAAMEMCLDITERKELERELQKSEAKYHDIFNTIPDAVFLLDPESYAILDCNRSAGQLYGCPKSELIGLRFLDFFHPDQTQAAAEAILKGKTLNQARQTGLGGREFTVSLSSTASQYAGAPVHLVTVSDITNRLATEQQLIQASKMATLGEMATGVAHEINQPLAVIQTSIDIIRRNLARDQLPEKPLLARITELVGQQIDRATRIISHMREFGRKSDVVREPVDLNLVLKRSYEFFSQQLSLHTIETVWELDERLPLVLCEANRMEQVCINFLINARDAIEERAARSGPQSPRRITIKTMHNREIVTIKLSDTGVGVPKHMVDKIFEPFFTTKKVGKGTGLGLSISYGIVKDYGGDIHVSDNPDGGASFYIRLPIAPAK